MKSTPVFVCIFLMICVASAKNLTCYNCFYYEGHKFSEPSCQNDPQPSMAKVCGELGCLPSNITNVTAYAFDPPNNNTALYRFPSLATEIVATASAGQPSGDKIDVSISRDFLLCSNFTGSVDAKQVVLRSCGFGHNSLDGKCTRNATITIDGRNATDVMACFCSKEKCNGPKEQPKPTPVPTTTQTPSGASNHHLTSYSLFAVAIVSAYKYLSFE